MWQPELDKQQIATDAMSRYNFNELMQKQNAGGGSAIKVMIKALIDATVDATLAALRNNHKIRICGLPQNSGIDPHKVTIVAIPDDKDPK